MRRANLRPRLAAGIGLLGVLGVASGCGTTASSGSGSGSGGGDAVTLHLGYLPNLTHAPAIVGLDKGLLGTALGASVTLKTTTFNAGPAAIQALLGGSLDAAYVGPNPAINGFIKSHGAALRVVSGATSGGAELVVQPDENINAAADLKGKKLGTPQLGNTQDVALRAWLSGHGLHTDIQGGGDVHISPADNSTTLQLFKQHQIDGAWLPEPFASTLVESDHGKVLVDEASLWPGGRFPTTELVVAAPFLNAHPDVAKRLVQGNLDAINWINTNPAQAKSEVNDALGRLTQKKLDTRVLDDAWTHLAFTPDPLAGALQRDVQQAHDLGLLDSTDIKGIFDLRDLNAVLQAAGQPAVTDAGLGA